VVAVTLVGVQGQNVPLFETLQPAEDTPKKSSSTIRHMSNNSVDNGGDDKEGRQGNSPKAVVGGRHDGWALVIRQEHVLFGGDSRGLGDDSPEERAADRDWDVASESYCVKIDSVDS